jgi:hypothetical protein
MFLLFFWASHDEPKKEKKRACKNVWRRPLFFCMMSDFASGWNIGMGTDKVIGMWYLKNNGISVYTVYHKLYYSILPRIFINI